MKLKRVISFTGVLFALSLVSQMIALDVDIYALFFALALSLFIIIYEKTYKKKQIKEFCIVVLLFTILSVKVDFHIEHWFICVYFIGGVLSVKSKEFLRAFLFTITIVALIGACSVFLTTFNGGISRQNALNVNPVWMSWLIGFGFIISAHDISKYKNIWICVFLFCAMIISGSRAPLGAAIICSFLIGSKKSVLLRIILTIVTIFSVTILLPMFRASFSANERGFLEDEARLNLLITTINMLFEKPSGYGFESFEVASFTYPHNLILEVLYSYGIYIGLVFLVFIIIRPLMVIINLKFINSVIAKLVIFAFLLSLFSGQIISHRLMFFLFGYVLSVPIGARFELLANKPSVQVKTT